MIRMEAMIAQGFGLIVSEIANSEKRRVVEDYLIRFGELKRRFARIAMLLQKDESLITAEDWKDLQGKGDNMIAAIDVYLSREDLKDPGNPARLPLFTAKALALRAIGDAEIGLRGNHALESGLQQFARDVSKEAFALCSGRTLYSLSCEVHEVIAQYAYLYRGLRRGATNGLQLFDDDEVDSLAPPTRNFGHLLLTHPLFFSPPMPLMRLFQKWQFLGMMVCRRSEICSLPTEHRWAMFNDGFP